LKTIDESILPFATSTPHVRTKVSTKAIAKVGRLFVSSFRFASADRLKHAQ